MKKKNSLKFKVWIYLSIFAVVIIGGIWLFQITFLNSYYEYSKNSEIKKIAHKVQTAYDSNDYSEILDTLAFRENICIEITTLDKQLYSNNNISSGCLIDNDNQIKKYKINFMNSNQSSITYKIINSRFNNKALIYGKKLDNNVYAFISTSLEPIGSTVSVLTKLLIYVTIIVFIIAFLIAYTISKKISKPIEQITHTSKKLKEGNYNIVFKTGTDITEINELEETLNSATTELSKTENLRRELLANVSHDLKTPLTLIKANAEMVKDLSYNNKEKMDKNLTTITSEVDRLNLLVEDILDLSKMQSSTTELSKEKFDLNELIKNIVDKFDILCEKDGYKINYGGVSAIIEADKKKIEQVIYNLINNAINYTGKDKQVYVKLTDLTDTVRVEIKDTGAGIDSEELKYIWDKYYKSDKKYKRVTYGTGLGLSIVKNILILHNFKYGVDSKKGKGTCFYFEIKK